MKQYFIIIALFLFSIITNGQTWNIAPSLELQLPSHSSKAVQNGVELSCRVGISYDVYKDNLNTTPIYHVESDENSNPKTVHLENNHAWEFYRFVKPAVYFIKLTNTSQNNNLKAGFIGYDYRYRYIRDVHYSEANEYFDLMNFHQSVGKGETAINYLDLNYFPEIPKSGDDRMTDKLVSFIVGGGSGHYEIKNQYFDIWYPFDTESTTKMALKTYWQPENMIYKYLVRDREDNSKTVTFELNTGLNNNVGSYRILAENGLHTQEDWLLIPKLTNARNYWFKFNCNAAFTDPKKYPNKYVYNIYNKENYCENDSECLNVSQNILNFGNTASSLTININAKGGWSASKAPAWLRLSQSSGKGSNTISITTLDNIETTSLNGTITISSYGCSYSKTIEINQAAAGTN